MHSKCHKLVIYPFLTWFTFLNLLWFFFLMFSSKVPFTLIPTILVAWLRGDLPAMWEGDNKVGAQKIFFPCSGTNAVDRTPLILCISQIRPIVTNV